MTRIDRNLAEKRPREKKKGSQRDRGKLYKTTQTKRYITSCRLRDKNLMSGILRTEHDHNNTEHAPEAVKQTGRTTAQR